MSSPASSTQRTRDGAEITIDSRPPSPMERGRLDSWSDPLPAAALLFAIGVWLGTADELPSLTLWCVGAAALALRPARYKEGVAAGARPASRVALALLLPLGVVRGIVCESRRPPDVLRETVGGRIFLRGVVVEPETVTPRACRMVIGVRSVAWRAGGQWRSATTDARVLVTLPTPRRADNRRWPSPAHWGQEVCLQGQCSSPERSGLDSRQGGSFDYAAWLLERDIYEAVVLRSAQDMTVCGGGNLAAPLRLAAAVRRRTERTFETMVAYPQSALLEGVVLAEGKGLPADLGDAFRATGTYHVLITAGIHINFLIVACIAVAGACGVGGSRAALLSIPVVCFYALVAGASPSIIRATIMGSIALVGHACGREAAGRRGLACAVLLMTAWNPRLVHDAGFQMSVACVLGILLLARPLEHRLCRLPRGIRGVLAVTMATQIMVAPLSVLYFGTLSLAGIVANVVVVPLCESLLGLGLLLGILGNLAPLFDGLAPSGYLLHWMLQPFAVCAWAVASIVLGVVSVLRDVPGCQIHVAPPAGGVGFAGTEVFLWYGAMWAGWKLLWRKRVPDKEEST